MKEATTLKQRFDFFKTTIGERNAKIGYYVKVFEISLRMVVDRKLQKNILVHKKNQNGASGLYLYRLLYLMVR